MASTRASGRRRPGAACGRRTSPSRRGPPASREDGIESTVAGHGQPLELGHDRGLGVLGDHVAGVDAGVVGEERRQAVRAGDGRACGRCGARRSTPRRRPRWRGSRARRRPVRRGSCRSTRPGRRRARPGCRWPRRARGRRRSRRARRCRARRRAPAASSAASTRPARGCSPGRGGWPRSRSSASRRARFGADAAWPGCGRSACRSAAKTRSVPSSASTLIAAVRSATRSSMPQVGDRQHEHAEHAVGAVDQREAFLLGQLDRR